MKKFFFIMIIIVFGNLINAQDVQLVIPKGSIENSIKTLLDARAASFSSYTGGYGVDMYNVKLIYSDSHPLTVTLIPPNTFRLSCGIVGRANVDYFLDEFEISIEGNITIEGTLSAQGSQGQLTLIGSGEAVINYSGLDGFLLSLILADELNFPNFELASFVFTLPTVP